MSCSQPGGMCTYAGECCACNSFPGCASGNFWFCIDTTLAGCPAAAPNPNDPCDTPNKTCVFCGGGSVWSQLCSQGKWSGRNPLGCS